MPNRTNMRCRRLTGSARVKDDAPTAFSCSRPPIMRRVDCQDEGKKREPLARSEADRTNLLVLARLQFPCQIQPPTSGRMLRTPRALSQIVNESPAKPYTKALSQFSFTVSMKTSRSPTGATSTELACRSCARAMSKSAFPLTTTLICRPTVRMLSTPATRTEDSFGTVGNTSSSCRYDRRMSSSEASSTRRASMEDTNLVSDAFRLRYLVRRKKIVVPSLHWGNEALKHLLDSHWIKPLAGFVKYKHLGLAGKGEQERQLCPHPFGKRVNLPVKGEFVCA